VLGEKTLNRKPLVDDFADAVAKQDSGVGWIVIGLNEDGVDQVSTAFEGLMEGYDAGRALATMSLADAAQKALADGEHAADCGHGNAEDLAMWRHG
jgi:hypothetical protein